MRWSLLPIGLTIAAGVQAQQMPAHALPVSSQSFALHSRTADDEIPDGLPDAPSFVQAASEPDPCKLAPSPGAKPVLCTPPEDPFKIFLNAKPRTPLTPMQKGKLAVRGLRDPFNALTIVGNAAYTVASDPRTAYGPGLKGFGKDVGYSYLQDATGTFFGAFAIPSITHEDPRYYRMPHARIPRRVLHAVSRTILAQSDAGHAMPNYASLLTNPICAEISNLYVPGVATNAPSTTKRIMLGYATDPVGNMIAEFLPDVASHIHIQILFVQRILNQVTAPSNNAPGQP